MHGLVVIEGLTLSGHPWIINEICRNFFAYFRNLFLLSSELV